MYIVVFSIAISLLFAWLGILAGRLKTQLVLWSSIGVSTLLVILCGTVSAVMIVGLNRAHSRSASVPNLQVQGTTQQIQRGKAIASAFCDACHSSTGTLTGGRDLGEHFPAPVGQFVAANLTPAGGLSKWSDGEIFRAIRNGIDADGRWLTVMSLTNAGKLSDDDTIALIAYIRSLPAAGQPTPAPLDRFNLLGLVMLGVGVFPVGNPVFVGAITAPHKAPTARYGEYILSYQDCRTCHGADLTGGVAGQLGPIGPGLALVKDWKLEEFIKTLRVGIDPSGHQLDPKLMPWRVLGKMDDEELGAIYRYLIQLPQS